MGKGTTIPVRVVRREEEAGLAGGDPTAEATEGATSVTTVRPSTTGIMAEAETAGEWRDRALRLQAEMENFRRRQQRLAENQIETERQRMLLSFLRVVDDLERALIAPRGSEEGLREGVRLTHKAALQLLGGEGARRIEAEGQPFDPHWHEAVATVDSRSSHAAPNTVVQVTDAGYRLDGQVLRPARVVVAV